MTESELQELRDWAAQKMGWNDVGLHYTKEVNDIIYIARTKEDTSYGNGWRPDDINTGQIWMLVERMRELGWWLKFIGRSRDELNECAEFVAEETTLHNGIAWNPNPCRAILLAARATEG